MTHSSNGLLARAALVLLLAGPAMPGQAGEFNTLGDGSGFDNLDLVRPDGEGCENCRTEAPYEWDAPALSLDWSLGLRGAIVDGTSGTKYEVLALPAFSLSHRLLRGGFSVGGNAEFSYRQDGSARIDALTLSGSVDHQFDTLTRGTVTGNFTASQDDPDGAGYASNVASTPLELTGKAEASIVRDLGMFQLALRDSVDRSTYGDTVFDDASTLDNSYQNTSTAGAGGRLGLRLGPIVTAFVDGEAELERYDAVSPTLLKPLDNVTYEGRSGLSAKFGETLELEASLGLAYRDFADAGIADFYATLYDAKVVFKPDETLSLTGELTTTVGSPGSSAGASGKVTTALAGEARYQVNPWLRLRANGGWSEGHFAGIDNDEYKWNVGTGADYLLNEHTDVTADYAFSRSETTPDPATDEHRVTLGLTFHR